VSPDGNIMGMRMWTRADRPRPAATWQPAVVLGALVVVALLSGCAPTGGAADHGSPLTVTDVRSVAGHWSGLLEISGRRQEDFVQLTISPDGAYQMHGARTIGALEAQGRVEATGGTLQFRGSRATATGTLYATETRPTLVIEGRSERGERVTARLRSKRP
jgi:hypothetical protein